MSFHISLVFFFFRDPMLVLEVNGSRVPLSSLLKRFMLKSLSKRSMKRSEEKKIAAAVMLKPNLRPLPRLTKRQDLKVESQRSSLNWLLEKEELLWPYLYYEFLWKSRILPGWKTNRNKRRIQPGFNTSFIGVCILWRALAIINRRYPGLCDGYKLTARNTQPLDEGRSAATV